MKFLRMKTSLSSFQKPNKFALQPIKACKSFEHFQLEQIDSQWAFQFCLELLLEQAFNLPASVQHVLPCMVHVNSMHGPCKFHAWSMYMAMLFLHGIAWTMHDSCMALTKFKKKNKITPRWITEGIYDHWNTALRGSYTYLSWNCMESHWIACNMHGIVWAKHDQCMEFHINNLIQYLEATPGIYSKL